MEVHLQFGNTLRWMRVPWIKRFVTKQHTSQHCRDKLDIEKQMEATSCIMWWLFKLHWLEVGFSGYWWIKCVIGGCANTNAKTVIRNKVFTPIYCPNLSRNYLLHLIWYTNIFYASELKLSDILSEFSCRSMILTLPSLKSHQSTSLEAIQPFLNIYVHEDSYLLGC
jgi:hypothetical protein